MKLSPNCPCPSCVVGIMKVRVNRATGNKFLFLGCSRYPVCQATARIALNIIDTVVPEPTAIETDLAKYERVLLSVIETVEQLDYRLTQLELTRVTPAPECGKGA